MRDVGLAEGEAQVAARRRARVTDGADGWTRAVEELLAMTTDAGFVSWIIRDVREAARDAPVGSRSFMAGRASLLVAAAAMREPGIVRRGPAGRCGRHAPGCGPAAPTSLLKDGRGRRETRIGEHGEGQWREQRDGNDATFHVGPASISLSLLRRASLARRGAGGNLFFNEALLRRALVVRQRQSLFHGDG
jgi:hypothetical protein